MWSRKREQLNKEALKYHRILELIYEDPLNYNAYVTELQNLKRKVVVPQAPCVYNRSVGVESFLTNYYVEDYPWLQLISTADRGVGQQHLGNGVRLVMSVPKGTLLCSYRCAEFKEGKETAR